MTTAGENIRTPLLAYRVMAWTTGLWLIALCYELVVHYIVKVSNPPTWIGIVHGWVYFAYVLAAFNLAVKVRWPIPKTIGVLLAGTIPLLMMGQRNIESRLQKLNRTQHLIGQRRMGAHHRPLFRRERSRL